MELNEVQKEMIAGLVKDGCTSGYGGAGVISWEFSIDEDDFHDDDNEYELDYIASLIERGNTSGFYPCWSLSVELE